MNDAQFYPMLFCAIFALIVVMSISGLMFPKTLPSYHLFQYGNGSTACCAEVDTWGKYGHSIDLHSCKGNISDVLAVNDVVKLNESC